MINLAQKKSTSSADFEKTAKTVKMVSTVVLLIWVVIMVGFTGYTLFMSNRQTRINNRLTSLEAQVSGYSEQEILVRKIYSRATNAREFLNTRPLVGKQIDSVLNASTNIVSWRYDSELKQSLTSTVGSPNEFNTIVETLQPKYTKLKLDEVKFKAGEGWTGTLTMSGFKP